MTTQDRVKMGICALIHFKSMKLRCHAFLYGMHAAVMFDCLKSVKDYKETEVILS